MKSKFRPLMFVGTSSDVGKSILATGLCRILLQDGYTPAPFKAQNMALNSFVTPEGLELGRSQAVQAEASGILPHTDMNPLLLKPSSDKHSQVILLGKPIGNKDTYEYFRTIEQGTIRQEVHQAFDRLSAKYNPIVMEGAGSISELNLQARDLVNMSMAEYAGATTILVADIDRGGVFASVYGSIMLQIPEHRKLIKGIIINKFRGDVQLFEEGKQILEELCKVPVLGVIPHFTDIHIEEEDSVALSKRNSKSQEGRLNVAVVLLPYVSNYTDFARLERDERLHLYYTRDKNELAKADIIILGGSKNTLSDLQMLWQEGLAQTIIEAKANGKTILGICGGYQMLGAEVSDPNKLEGDLTSQKGLGLLPIKTEIQKEKLTQQTKFHFLDNQELCQAYEIHQGQTSLIRGAEARPLARLEDGRSDGYFLDQSCMGTYLHGILDNPAFVDFLLSPFKDKIKLSAETSRQDYQSYKEEQYDKLANHLRQHLDLEKLYQLMAEDN